MARESRYPHLDAMTSSQLDAYLVGSSVTPDEDTYIRKLLAKLRSN